MNDEYEEIMEQNFNLIKEKEQLKSDLRDARQALAANKAVYADKLAAARLVQACEICPKWEQLK